MVAPAPIALELVANPPPDGDLARALVGACSGAAGPGGCVLADSTGDVVPRARIVVTFSPDGARVRVEVLATGTDAGAATGTSGGEASKAEVGVAASREVAFREGDPRIERFRAAGLVAAGLAADLSNPGPEAGAVGGEPAGQEGAMPVARPGVVVRLGGSIGGNGGRPWAGAELGGDFGVVGPWFVGLSGAYGQRLNLTFVCLSVLSPHQRSHEAQRMTGSPSARRGGCLVRRLPVTFFPWRPSRSLARRRAPSSGWWRTPDPQPLLCLLS
jgi:hypothetical protein